jgi:23S rRNA G2069 N7-methylase RlmK/C1962 C5-methylase RlmI
LKDACAKSDRQVRILGMGLQAKDHPILISMPETEYLKFAILEVV